VAEWPKMSNRAIAATCGVSTRFVDKHRPTRPAMTMGLDGKERPTVGTGNASTANGSQLTEGAEAQDVVVGDEGAQDVVEEGPPEEVRKREVRWVRVEAEPVVGEVLPWVQLREYGDEDPVTWGDLAELAGVERQGDFVDRELVKAGCREARPGQDVDEWGKVRQTEAEEAAGVPRRAPEPVWGGFRDTIISNEHARRARTAWVAELDRAQRLEWARVLAAELRRKGRDEVVRAQAAMVLAAQVWKVATLEGRRLAAEVMGETVEEAESRILEGNGGMADALLLVLEPEVSERGTEWVEEHVLGCWYREEE